MTPTLRVDNFGVKRVNLMYCFKNLLLFSGVRFRQTSCIVMMTKEGFFKIVNFMTLRTGVLVLGHGHISHIVKMRYLLLYQYCKGL